MPFWSSQSRVEKIIGTVSAYAGFRPVEVSWEEFCTKWVPDLAKSDMLVGVNWSGKNATGYDLQPARVRASVQALIDDPSADPHYSPTP